MQQPAPTLFLVGNPENRRVTLFQEALVGLGHPPARVLPYERLLSGEVSLGALPPGAAVRIESPGEHPQVHRHLLARGGVEGAHDLPEERGQILHPGAWYRGFVHLLEELERTAPPGVRWFNPPADLALMFHKPRSKARFPAAPATLPAFACYDELRAWVAQGGARRLFIKLNSESSASGVIAWQCDPRKDRVQAITSMEAVPHHGGWRFYNSLRLCRYERHETIAPLVDFILKEGGFAEPWIPKATHEGLAFDLRVVAIAGRRHHTLARGSRSPLTNLHLGNRRIALEDLDLPEETLAALDHLTETTMAAFPRSLYAGLDVVLPKEAAPLVLEINGFGDLLPNLRHRGATTYEAEIAVFFGRAS